MIVNRDLLFYGKKKTKKSKSKSNKYYNKKKGFAPNQSFEMMSCNNFSNKISWQSNSFIFNYE